MNKSRELHESRLATTDEQGHRVHLYPEDVKGIWRKRRTFVFWPLILIYLLLPWIRLNGAQAIRLDIPKREFYFFGTTFLGHDAPMILLVLLSFVFALGFVTSLWGRAWCGWACPQTVFIDAIFRKIEILVEGNARSRAELAKTSWNGSKILKKTIKWALFTLVSLHISHSFLGYFVGTHELISISLHRPQDNWTLFTIMLFLTGLFLFDFGWFREQFCIIACPYGRFQSVIMDRWSKVVAYNSKRGEPRRSPEIEKHQEGDCINCFHCVKVCPTGIDIRRGTQLECIACTNCIDACDEIMHKLNRPKGLISYTSEAELLGESTKHRSYRSYLYFLAFTASVVLFIYSILSAQQLKIGVIRATGAPFTSLENGLIQNQFRLTIDYKRDDHPIIRLEVEDKVMANHIQLTIPGDSITVKNTHQSLPLFVRFDPTLLKNGTAIIVINFKSDDLPLIRKEVPLVGPIE